MTTTQTNSTVSAEQAMEAVERIKTKGDPEDVRYKFGKWEDDLQTILSFIAQHSDACGASSTEPVAAERQAFEEWITAPPYKLHTDRFGDDTCWPGQYRANDTQIAWDAWQEAIRRRFAAQGQSGAKVSRYPWKDAPVWAMWAATDEDGLACWFEVQPTWLGRGWANSVPHAGRVSQMDGVDFTTCPDWRDSLEQRPTGGGE